MLEGVSDGQGKPVHHLITPVFVYCAAAQHYTSRINQELVPSLCSQLMLPACAPSLCQTLTGAFDRFSLSGGSSIALFASSSMIQGPRAIIWFYSHVVWATHDKVAKSKPCVGTCTVCALQLPPVQIKQLITFCCCDYRLSTDTGIVSFGFHLGCTWQS